MPARQLINGALRPLGYRIISAPKAPTLAPAKPAPAAPPQLEFFPTAVHPRAPWPIPADLAASNLDWHKVLCEVYRERVAFPASVSPEAGMFIHALVRNIQPRVAVETGTCLGVSTIWIAAALADSGAALHTYDDFATPTVPRLRDHPLFQDRLPKLQDRLRRAGVADRVRIHVGDSRVELPRSRDQLRAPGTTTERAVHFAFIDGDHTPFGASKDFLAVEPLLATGGYVLFHDTYPAACSHEGPRYVMDHIREIATGAYELCEIYTAPSNYGLGLLRRTS